LPVGADDLAALRRWAGAQAPAVLVQRAKILLLAAEEVANTEIALRLGISRPTVIAWRKRYAHDGLTAALPTGPNAGAPRPSAATGAPRSWRSRSVRRPNGLA
jgi:hypothetical protein